jgi:hypothetical protein
VDPLTLTSVLSLFNPYINITFQSSFQHQYHFHHHHHHHHHHHYYL